MRILIVLPEQDRATGNWATARRFRLALERLGHTVDLCATSLESAELLTRLADFHPDLALLLHAYRSGRPWLGSGTPCPYIVVLTGTDINQGMEEFEQGPVIGEVLSGARSIIIQNPLLAENFRNTYPRFSKRLHVLPPAVALGAEPFALRRKLGISETLPLFLCPAGLRPVKNQGELLDLFASLAPDAPPFHIGFCGPVLDPAYAGDFLDRLRSHPWGSYLGIIPPQAMAAALRSADVVVNHSIAEGLPNALVEAAALGRPILARDIPGNAAVVMHGNNGLLYSNAAEFTRCATRLLSDPEFRLTLAQPSPDRYAPEIEGRELEKICRGACNV